MAGKSIVPLALAAGAAALLLGSKKKKSGTTGPSASPSTGGSGSTGFDEQEGTMKVADLSFVPERDEEPVRQYVASTLNNIGNSLTSGADWQLFALSVCNQFFPYFPDDIASAGAAVKKGGWAKSIWDNVTRIIKDVTGKDVPGLVMSVKLG